MKIHALNCQAGNTSNNFNIHRFNFEIQLLKLPKCLHFTCKKKEDKKRKRKN